MSEKAGGEVQFRRFASLEKGWSAVKDRKEALSFQFSGPSLLSAFGIAAAADLGQAITLTEVRVLAGNSLLSKVVYASAETLSLYTLQDQDPVHRVTFQPPLELAPARCYTLLVTLQNCAVYQGIGGLAELRNEVVGECRFVQTVGAQEAKVNSGDMSGPLIDLYCVPPVCNPKRIKDEIAAILSDKIEANARQVLFTRYSNIGSSWHVNSDGKQAEAITFRTNFQGQVVALGVGNAFNEGSQTRLKVIELHRGPGTRGEMLYQHSQTVDLNRQGGADAFMKVSLSRPVPVLPGEYYTLRVQYEENSVVVRGTVPSAIVIAEGATVAFQRANFEGGDVENGSHETHGPLRDLYFVIG